MVMQINLIWVILQELPNSSPQTLMSLYGFDYGIFQKLFVSYVDQYVCAYLQFKTCYFIKGKEAILGLFRQGVSFSRVHGAILHFSHTILN